MANQQYKSEVELALNAPNAKNLEKTIENILGMVDKLPASAKTSSAAVGEIIGQINKIKDTLKSTGSLNSVVGEVKGLAASLKSLNTLGKGLELFSNKDIQAINQAASSMRAAAKAYDEIRKASQIKQGAFGLDETTIAGTTRAAKVLQSELKGIQQTIATISGGGKARVNANDPLYQQGLLIQQNIDNLKRYQQSLQLAQEQERKLQQEQAATARRLKEQLDAEQKQKELFFKQGDGRTLAANRATAFATSPVGQQAFVNRQNLANNSTARFADPNFVNFQATRQSLSDEAAKTNQLLQQLGYRRQDAGLSQGVLNLTKEIRRLEGERTKELASGNAESAKSIGLSRQIQGLTSQRQLLLQQERRSDPARIKADEENRQNTILSRVSGAGGASLIAVQAALIANYAILNTIRASVSAITSSAVEYEAAMKNVQAVTATTGTEMVSLSEKIKKLSSDSRFTAVEIANAALVLGQAGLSAQQVGQALPNIITLATAAGSSLAQAVDLVTSVVGVFDKQVTDTGDIANKVTQAANSSKISVEKLGLALQYTGNAAAQSGITFEETTAAIAAMSNAGIKGGSTLGTGLRQFITELQKPSEEFVAALRRVGLSISDVDVRANGLIGVLKTLGASGFVAGDAIRSFDVRGAAAFNAMIANPADLDRQYNGLLNTRAALAANEIQMQSFQSQSLRLTNTLTNLATTGLEPIQKILTGVTRSLADSLQGMSGLTGTLQVLTAAATGFIAVGLLRHYGAMVPAILPWIGVNKTLATAIGTVSAMTLSQVAANVGLTASTTTAAATTGTLAASMTGLQLRLALTFAALTSASGAMGVLRVGVTALTGAIMGMSLGTVAILATLGYLAYSMLTLGDSSDKTKEKIDKLKAASNEAKGSFEETQSKVDSLTKKIDDLYYKQDSLKDGSKNLGTVTAELNAQFGSLGLKIDDNNNSFQTMIGKLKALRAEMRGVAEVKLGVQLDSEKELLRTQVKDFSTSVDEGKITRVVNNLEKFANRIGLQNSDKLTPTEKSAFSSAISGAKGVGSGSQESVVALQNALSILGRATPKDQEQTLDEFRRVLIPTIDKAAKVIETQSNIGALTATQIRLTGDRQFENTPNFPSRIPASQGGAPGGLVRFSDSFRAPYPVLAATERDNPNLPAGSLELLLAMKERTVREMDTIDNVASIIKAREASGELSPDIATSRLQDLNKARESYKSAGVAYYNMNAEVYKNEMKDRIELTKKKARGARGSARSGLLLEVGELEAQQATLGEFGTDEIMRSRAANRRAIARATADNASAKDGAQDAKAIARDAAAAYRREADLYGLQAKGKKLDATNKSNTVDEVDGYITEGMNLIAEEYKARVKSLIEEQKARGPALGEKDVAFRAEEIKALKQQGTEAVEQFVEGAVSIYAAVAKRSNKLGPKKDAAAMAEQLRVLKSDSEDRLFEQGQELADVRGRVARQLLPENSLEERKAVLAQTKAKIAEVTNELKFFGDETTGYIGTLKEIAQAASDRVRKLQDDLVNGDSNKQIIARGLLPGALDAQKSANSDVAAARKEKQAVRGNLRGLQQEEFVQAQAIPGEQSWDALKTKIQQVAENYKTTVDEMSQVEEIGKNFGTSLQGTTGIFSTFFTNLVSGTMSVKDAFKTMAVSIIKSMIDVLAQALALQAVKSILGAFLGNSGSGIAPTSAPTAYTGGSVNFASGGKVTGGVTGKDSVPLMAMPGEYILRAKASQALGDDFLDGLNSVTTSSLAGSSRSSGVLSTTGAKGTDKVINFWLVTPGQAPAMGPDDVEIAIANKLMTGGPLKELVKSVALGNM